jgi:hypothetical protein
MPLNTPESRTELTALLALARAERGTAKGSALLTKKGDCRASAADSL